MPESPFLIKLQKRDWHTCFPVNFAKFLRIPSLENTSGQLLPIIMKSLTQDEKFCWKSTMHILTLDMTLLGQYYPMGKNTCSKLIIEELIVLLTLSWRRPLLYRNQSIDLLANQWTGFYMITASVMKGLRILLWTGAYWVSSSILPFPYW